MEEDHKPKQMQKNNCITNAMYREIINNSHVYITTLDLSARNIDKLDDQVQFPANLLELNLSQNKFVEVPAAISNLEKLEKLDLSLNKIEYFDETPLFCHNLEQLDLSKNNLHGPPYWIWTEKPKQLTRVNLSCNTNITNSFINGYLEELLQYETTVIEIDLYYCGFRNTELLGTLTNSKTINLGNDEYNYHGANIVGEVPCKGLEKCCNIERLNLSNTRVHTIATRISMLKNLCDINLSNNNLLSLPNEFCSLTNLRVCILSYNKLLCLPEDMFKLTKLVRLSIDSNELCMIPERLLELPNLQALDLYDNSLNEITKDYFHLQELDLAQNYLDEPSDIRYLEMKEKLRLQHENRNDGRKPEPDIDEREYSSTDTDDEEYMRTVMNCGETEIQESPNPENDHCSSPEDWDSDSHWIPHDIKFSTPHQSWMHFIKRKMDEGNFCPIDAHVVSISEKVIYEKRLNPRIEVECIGQFDDYSSDES